ncbi:MAG: ABC transporter substrate-binding protein, partial [Myxococcota bacterium]
FRLWSSPAWEAREAARLAVALGHDRVAVLAPRDEDGELAAAVFARAATALGAEVVGRGFYEPTGTAVEPDIRRFLGLDPARNPRLRRHLRRYGRTGIKTFTPDVPFDLLYIPDQYQRAALVASFLPYFNVEVRSRDVMDVIRLRAKHRGRVPRIVQLLGSSGWHHPGIIPRGGSAIEGALIVDVFSGGDDEEYATEDGAEFGEAYAAATGRPASAIAAQAHDAALLVLAAAERTRARARRAQLDDARAIFAQELARGRLAAGACGPVRMGRDGELEREAILLRVDGGNIVLHEY